MRELLGRVFPAGAPVPPDLVIGRSGAVAALHARLRERVHTIVRGERRIGKTTVCDAAAARAQTEDDALVVRIEVPERRGGRVLDLLQLIVETSDEATRGAERRRLLRAARPALTRALERLELPLDLRELGAEPNARTTRQTVSLPLQLARTLRRATVFYLDELQRVADYVDGDAFVTDLVDVYAGSANQLVTVLVNGSDQRALELLERDLRLAKLCNALPLEPTIDAADWRPGLRDHYGRAGLEIDPDALEALIAYGAGRPYPTMLAALNSGLSTVELELVIVDATAVAYGTAEAERQLNDERF